MRENIEAASGMSGAPWAAAIAASWFSHRYRSTNAATGDMWGLSDLLALVSRNKGADSTDDSGDGDCDDWY